MCGAREYVIQPCLVKAIPPDMSPSVTIDVHAHILPEATIRRLAGESPRVAPKLIDAYGSTIMEINSKVVQDPMPREVFDLDLRLRDMDRHGVAMQLLAATVHTFFYHEEPALAAACAVVQNDEIAAIVDRHRDRFMGLATLPLQDPHRAADELTRAMTSLGLRGAQIGSNVNGSNLDDPALEPVWAVANERAAFFLIHPYGEILPGDRLKSYYMRNFVRPDDSCMLGRSGPRRRRGCKNRRRAPWPACTTIRSCIRRARSSSSSTASGPSASCLAAIIPSTWVTSIAWRASRRWPLRRNSATWCWGLAPRNCWDLRCIRGSEWPILRPSLRSEPFVSDLKSIREARLACTLRAVGLAHPFYRQRFRRLNIKADDIRSLDDLELLPLTAKDDYIADPEAFRLRADDLPADFSSQERVIWDIAYTTGTTAGRPSPFYNTTHDAYAVWDQARRCNEAEGLRPTDRVANLYPIADFPTGAFLSVVRSTMIAGLPVVHGLTGSATSEFKVRNSLVEAIDKITALRPTVLWGVPSFIRRFLAEAHRHGADFSEVRLVITSGEPVNAALRTEIREQLARLSAAAVEIRARYAFTEMQGGLVQCAEAAQSQNLAPDLYLYTISK
jgi:Amidohydrolase/AMP-binding enzyme